MMSKGDLMIISPKNRYNLVEAALGKRKLDLVIKNVKLVNVFTEEIYSAEIGIYDGFIAHVEAANSCKDHEIMKASNTFDGQGMYIIPGLIDSHVHIESSMMIPRNFAKTVVPLGTTTVVTDPHEIANVLGLKGVKYMLNSSKDLPMNQYILTPSCVPSVPGYEESGASFTQKEIRQMLEWDRVLGVAEVMDFPGVLAGNDRMWNILKEAKDRNSFIQGHSPGLKGRNLSAYLCAGPESDHEITGVCEAREKLRLGMTVDARESSMSQNLKAIIASLPENKLPANFTLCTDDREPADLLNEGHMNYVVKRAIEEGLKPVQAIKAATLQAASSIGIKNLGAIAPGYPADMVLLLSLKKMDPACVFYQGELVAEDEELKKSISTVDYEVEKMNTVYLSQLTEDDFKIRVKKDKETIKTRVISYSEKDPLYTEFDMQKIPVTGGILNIKSGEKLNYISVFNRHKGKNQQSSGVIKNFGLKKGAIASTISHDCHNLVVVYTNFKDAVIAANSLINSGGGIACVQKGKVVAELELPVAGLMSTLQAEELSRKVNKVKNSLKKLGLEDEYPLLKITTLTLAVIPEAKITDQGILSVNEQKFVSLFP